MVEHQDISLENQRSLGRLEGKLDAMVIMLTEHIRKDEIAWAKVAHLEKKIIWASGVAATIMFFITAGTTKLLSKMGLV